MNIRTLYQSKGRRLLVLVLPVLVALLLVGLVIGSLTVFAFGDLQVTFESGPPGTVDAGGSYSFQVKVKNVNTGGDTNDAEAVVFEYRPPPDVAVTSISGPGPCEAGTKNDPSDPATCALGNMGDQAEALIDITVKVDETVLPGTMLDNDVRAWQDGTEDDVPSDNESHAFVEVILGPADLRITKFGKPDGKVEAGQLLTYTVIVDNLGPSVAPIVVMTDTLVSSGNFELVAVNQIDRSGASCSPESGSSVGQRLDITCQLDSLEPLSTTAGSGRWTIEIVVTADETQDINNVAEVDSSRFDPDTSNNLATVEHDITDVSDLEISKQSVGEVQIYGQRSANVVGLGVGSQPTVDTVTAGLPLVYTLVITNYGPSTAENVVVQDRLPPGIVVRSATATQGDCDTGTPGEPLDKLTCGLGTLSPYPDPGASVTIVITADVSPSLAEGTILENDVLVFSDIFDPDNTNNYDHNLTTVSTWADLEISKSARGDNVNGYVLRQFTKVQVDDNVTAGELLQYTLVVTNTGPSDAQNVVITDTLPPPAGPIATVHFVSADGATCRQDPVDRNEITCELGPMAVDEMRTVYILVRVDPAAAGPTNTANITNVATVSSDTNDPYDGEPPVGSGDNNTATNDTTVNAVADVHITKVDVPAEERLDQPFEPDQAIAGNEHRYLITFGNDGPSVARSVAITDTLDIKQDVLVPIPGETFVRCEPTDWDDLVACWATTDPWGDPIVVLSYLYKRDELIIPGDLNPGDEFSFWLITEVDPGYVLDADISPPIFPPNPLIARNRSDIGTTTTDYHGQNNYDHEDTEIIAEADLAVSKTDTPDPGLPDAYLTYDPVTNHFVFTYTITVNNLGPSDAATILLTDTLPVDTEFITWTIPANMQCVFRDDGTVFCLMGQDPNNLDKDEPGQHEEPGRMNVGSEISFTITARVDAGLAPRILVNRVEVGAVSPEYADVYFPTIPTVLGDFILLIPDFLPDRRPTADPNLGNNVYIEETTVANPGVRIDKKAVVGRDLTGLPDAEIDEICRTEGVDDFLTLPPAQVTYCYFVYNEGDTWLTNVEVTDAHTANIVETVAGPFVNVIGRAGTGSQFNLAHALWASIENDAASEVAPLAPAGQVHPDGYTYLLAVRAVTLDFPELGPIAGIVWEDTNENHVVDLNEPLSAGVVVDLFYESGFPLALDTRTTGAGGRYAFHGVAPGKYKVRVHDPGPPSVLLGVLPVIELDPPKGYSIANLDTLTGEWYIESEEYAEPIFRRLGTNTARVDTIPSTKYSTPLPGIEPSGDCEDPNLVCDTDLLHDTLALPVLEDTTKEWAIYEDNGDDLPSPGDVIEYTVDIPNTGIIEATGVEFYDGLYNWINDDVDDLKVPGWLINGSVSAAIHVYGREPDTGRVIDANVQPPDLAFGEDLLLRTYAPAIGGGYLELTYPSAIVLDGEIIKGNTPGEDEVQVATRLAIPPVGYLLRFDGVTYDPPIPVTFSLRIKYQVRIKETKYVRLGTIVLNHGWVSYNEIGLFDQRFPDFDPANVNQFFDSNREANNHAGTPGRAWERPEFPGWPEIPPDVEPTNFLGPRFDEYPRPELPGADPYDDDPTWFELKRLPRRIQLPAIDNQDGWETQIQVQNGGDEDTGAIVFFWGEYSGLCPSNDPGPVGHACKRILENAVWALKTQSIPSTAKSAIVYSVDKDLFEQACDAADYVFFEPSPLDPRSKSAKWRDWEDDYEGTGEAIAVIVQRKGPNDHDTMVSSAYPGISENREGGGPPYKYFAPYAMRQYHNLDTEMIIHNSGRGCASIVLNYQKQGDCIFSYDEDIVLAPGESVRRRVPEVLGAMWLGSIYVESDEPLGIVMDQTSFLPSEDRGALLTYEARPYKLTTDTLFYADLVWREVSGWEASIQVQNLTQHSLPTFVTVEFFDASGDSILFLGDWVCRAGGATFYLPAIVDLGMAYAGAAVIQSHAQVDYPGGKHDGQPIFAVVDLKKTRVYDEALHRWRPTIPGEIQGGAYNALAEGEKKATIAIMLPHLAKARDSQGVTSLIAVRNNSNCNDIGLKLEVTNLVGTVVTYLTNFWLPAGHIKLIDLANVGTMNPGFVGAGTVEVTYVEQLCDEDNDGHVDEAPTMFSVVVVNKGAGSGDVTEVYKGIPVRDP